jgi:formamidopyrimidine-DNA glycosylase
MPELPEVEDARRRAQRALAGKRISRVEAALDPLVFEGLSPRRIRSALLGRRVEAVRRRGKHLWLVLDGAPCPLFHFGLTGSLTFYRASFDRPRFWKLELAMADGTHAAFADPRRFGRIRLRDDPPREPPVSELGFDALTDPPSFREIAARLARRHAPLKAVLLDQGVFAGVGNWVADEVLYQAALRPDRPADSLQPAEVRRLLGRLVSVVRTAVDARADAGRFPRSWLFHHRWGRRDAGARTSRGEAVAHATIAGRTTAWVPSRQS